MLLEHPGSSCQNAGNYTRYSSSQGKRAISLHSFNADSFELLYMEID